MKWFRHMCSLKQSEKNDEAGYMLLEVIVATAVAASVVTLLLTALTGLGKAQTRIGNTTQILSEQIFNETLLARIIENVRPAYHDDEMQFQGEELRISGRTYLDSFDGNGKVFSLQLQSDNADRVDLVLQLGNDIHIISRLPEGDYSFGYMDHFGEVQRKWDPVAEGVVDKKLIDQAPHVSMIPRQFQIRKRIGNQSEILLAYNFPYTVFPPRRPDDTNLYLGRM